ncbi:MAG: 3-dehydro-4-phosphotetronate decarboxylase [Thermodesulfobacteriota bacterium]|nr:3-dehydro-4-phosphotetronate decarboxylase [Thermodesulfobacteriota bacterium]
MDRPDIQEIDFSPSREDFCGFCRLLYDRHLAAGVGGNVAARCGNRIWLTSTGCSLRDVQPENIAVVDMEGLLIQGERPTKEAGMHLGVLLARPDMNVVCHLHGANIIAASTLLDPGPTSLPALTPGFVYHAFPLPMLPFMVPGSPDLAKSVTEALSDKRTCAILLKNHGLVTTGKDFWEALNIAEEIDEAARVYVLTAGKAPPIPREDIDRIKSLGISELSH